MIALIILNGLTIYSFVVFAVWTKKKFKSNLETNIKVTNILTMHSARLDILNDQTSQILTQLNKSIVALVDHINLMVDKLNELKDEMEKPSLVTKIELKVSDFDMLGPQFYNTDLTLDSILDKINECGIDSLTDEEKEFLDKNNK